LRIGEQSKGRSCARNQKTKGRHGVTAAMPRGPTTVSGSNCEEANSGTRATDGCQRLGRDTPGSCGGKMRRNHIGGCKCCVHWLWLVWLSTCRAAPHQCRGVRDKGLVDRGKAAARVKRRGTTTTRHALNCSSGLCSRLFPDAVAAETFIDQCHSPLCQISCQTPPILFVLFSVLATRPRRPKCIAVRSLPAKYVPRSHYPSRPGPKTRERTPSLLRSLALQLDTMYIH
jgi:hypothetical protein